MIARIWHGRTHPQNAEKYLRFLLGEGTDEYRQVPGNLSVHVFQGNMGDSCHFYTVTQWKDVDAIRKFAGEDIDRAKYYEEDNGVLLEFEPNVQHFTSFDVSNRRIREYCDQLKSVVSGSNWFGESFMEKLRDVDESMAFERPVPKHHAIAEVLWHCQYWRTVLLSRLEEDSGYKERTTEKMNFLPLDSLKEKTWKVLTDEFMDTQEQLLELLSQRTDPWLQEQYADGYTNDYHLRGTIQHDIYHLGQIGFIKASLISRA